jgi:CheY-like chemotaxis protein
MARVVSVNLDAARVEGVLSTSKRRVVCREAVDASSILARAGLAPPDLVVLSGEASKAADVAEALIDDPVLLGTAMVAWHVRGSLGDTARLVALGVRMVTGEEDALRTAGDEALDAREGRTIRVDAPTELATRGASPAAPDLHGRRVIVADDDPAIRWFLADVLRAHGCDVEEVSDGDAALDHARRSVPDLVVSDIRMPRLDGVRLCRALRSDPILADVPIVLLSWKEDWLRQAEGGGAEASAYLAKRSTPEEVLLRVHEILEPHARLERRLRKAGAVRGRLDGTAPYRLLRLACSTHPDARLTVRSTPHTYEVRIRGGAPRSAIRVSSDGSVVRGAPVLASLLGERAGRFTLAPEQVPLDADLGGTLHQQIAACVARFRRGAEGPPGEAVAEPDVLPAAVAAHEEPRPAAEILAVGAPAPAVEPQPEPVAATWPIAPRPFVPGVVLVTSRAAPERTLPLPLPLPLPRPMPVAPRAPAAGRGDALRTPRSSPRSWGAPLRWIGIAAVAALGIVLGAGVRALRQPPAGPPAIPAATAPRR